MSRRKKCPECGSEDYRLEKNEDGTKAYICNDCWHMVEIDED